MRSPIGDCSLEVDVNHAPHTEPHYNPHTSSSHHATSTRYPAVLGIEVAYLESQFHELPPGSIMPEPETEEALNDINEENGAEDAPEPDHALAVEAQH